VLLSSEAASFGQPGSSSSGLAEDSGAPCAYYHCLGVTEDGGDSVTTGTLNVHEVAVWMLHEPFQLVPPLLFMLLGMQQILCEGHCDFSERSFIIRFEEK